MTAISSGSARGRDGGMAGENVRAIPTSRRPAGRVRPVARLLGWDASWHAIEGLPSQGQGAMRKLFIAEAWIEDAADMVDLCAPDSILGAGVEGSIGDGDVELSYRHSTAYSIYGGSSEIMRSIVAQVVLGMPRSRS